MKPILLGLHGKPRSGKDTLAAHLIAKHNLLRHGPSVYVKNATAAMFNIPREYLDDDNKKDTYDPYWKLTYREMAQKVGKESSRDVFGDDFWMRHVQRTWVGIRDAKTFDGKWNTSHVVYKGMILADIRYANEVEWVKKNGGDVIFITRSNLPASSGTGHAAEQGLSLDLADMIVYNDSTISELYENIDRKMASYYSW